MSDEYRYRKMFLRAAFGSDQHAEELVIDEGQARTLLARLAGVSPAPTPAPAPAAFGGAPEDAETRGRRLYHLPAGSPPPQSTEELVTAWTVEFARKAEDPEDTEDAEARGRRLFREGRSTLRPEISSAAQTVA